MSSSPDSSVADNAPMCRICFSGGSLISVCHCKGSIAFVHVNCLEKWINTSRQLQCELCGFHYATKCFLKYGKLASIMAYFQDENSLLYWARTVIHLAIMTLALLIRRASICGYYILYGDTIEDEAVKEQQLVLCIHISVITSIYSFLSTVTFYQLYHRWVVWRRNQIWISLRLPIDNTSNQVPPEPPNRH